MDIRKLTVGVLLFLAVSLALVVSPARGAEPVRGAEAAKAFKTIGEQEGAGALAKTILESYHGPDGAAQIEGLGIALAMQPDLAQEVLNAVAESGAADEALIRAHLLLEIAMGPGNTQEGRYGRGAYRTKKSKEQHCLVDPLAERAGELLRHPDPVVRALAEWAINIRVANDNEKVYVTWGCASGVREWPKEDPPAWFARWYSLTPSDYVALDYGRQAVDADVHRTAEDLLNSARAIARRAAQPTQGPGDAPEVQEARREVNEAVQALADFARRNPTDLTGQRRLWLAMRRAARKLVLLNPAVDFSGITYVARHSGRKHLVPMSSRSCDHPPGGDIYVQDGLAPDAPVRGLIGDRLDRGHVQDMDLRWEGDRIVFAHSEQSQWGRGNWSGMRDGVLWNCGSEPVHLYEVNVDGTGFRQLTDHPRFADIEPAYLPDGHVVFASDRSRGSTHCGDWHRNSFFCPPNLYRINPETREIKRLSYNKDEDRYPHVTNDGRVVYMRWDYQERAFSPTQPLWIINPDGTMNDALYKAHTNDPRTLRDPRPTIGSEKLVAIACGHHEPIEGALALIDLDAGRNGRRPMRYVTPKCSPTEFGYGSYEAVPEGGVQDHFGLYKTPFGLSEDSFLVSYAYRCPGSTSFATYYVDVWGNKELIRRDPIYDVVVPLPLKPRRRPPQMPSPVDPTKDHALVYVSDVYNDLSGVEKGEVKYIRILERLGWFDKEKASHTAAQWGLFGYGQFGHWTEGQTRIVGTVPVEEDGSAYFKVPTNMAVFFQALDENRLEVRRMRTHVEFQPGEFRGCIGCHETQMVAAPETGHLVSRAVLGKPATPEPPPWGDTEVIDFEDMIQPIFENHCVKCHGARNPKGNLNLTARADEYGFMQSYRSLLGVAPDEPTPNNVGPAVIDGVKIEPNKEASRHFHRTGRRENCFMPEGSLLCLSNYWAGTEITQPRQFGSYRSPLIRKLLDDPEHRAVREKLTPAQWETLVTWIDVNAPYHGTHLRYLGSSRKTGWVLESVKVRLDPPFKRGEKDFVIEECPPQIAEGSSAN